MFNFLYNLIVFVIAVFFVVLGLIGVVLPWSAGLRTDIVEFILANSIAISLFGFGFIIIGGTLLLNMILSTRRRYYNEKVGSNLITIDETVMLRYLQMYWERIIPTQEVPTRLLIKKNKIKISADFPFIPREEQDALIANIKQDLREIFTKVLGYPYEFSLSLSFQKK